MHKQKVLEVATMAVAEGKKPLLGVLYDEMCRWPFFYDFGMITYYTVMQAAVGGASVPTGRSLQLG
eukprot:8817417-Karenia_brevis.AAC.1